MPRVALLAAALLVPVVPAVVAAPAYAVDHVICVGDAAGPCDESAPSIDAANVLADGNDVADVIRVGTGTWTEPPLLIDGSTHGLTLEGSGPDTVITVASGPPQQYVRVWHATLRDVTVVIDDVSSQNDTAVVVGPDSLVEDVRVTGDLTTNALGMELAAGAVVARADVEMTLGQGSKGVVSPGGATLTDSTVRADTAFEHSGAGTDRVTRSTIEVGDFAGVSVDSGVVLVDNTVIDLGAGAGVGLQAANFNGGSDPISISAENVTVVGGGAGSRGVWAYAATPTSRQSAAVGLYSSIVRGPETSLVVEADNDGTPGQPSVAAIGVGWTDFEDQSVTIGAHGDGNVADNGGNVDVDPLFVDAAAGDYRLSAVSPVIDAGEPAEGLPSDTDRAGGPRVVDGDLDTVAVRDMGAYEYRDTTAPQTYLAEGPSGLTNDPTPTFAFKSEAGASFECKVGGSAWTGCTSPFTTDPLPDGATTFRVRAADAWGNTDATPAERSFRVDATPPQTRLTGHPPRRTTKKKVTFEFTSEKGAIFGCNLDRTGWKACTSPRTYRVPKGRHVFWVMAVDKAGNNDPTAATFRFRRR